MESSELPFDFFIYIGTVHLNRKEEEVWKMTLRKLLTLWDSHCTFKGWKKEKKEQVPTVFADQVKW
ncbi:hypothetical protein [Viridibacillus sp. FSL H7-0596]|uniref:hypothetical protein n=1 Tax=Viridibacillus sp. FSL H7-0596 TaxID=1928923 RepID=UPI001AF0178B|nr:hypothetical protein [Viridibacillus sp. FSL H7-0596]